MRLKELPVGAKVRERTSNVVFLIAEQEENATALITDNVVMLGCMDAPEPGNPDWMLRMTGWNNYRLSNLHQWLNAAGKDWYVPSHAYDEPPTEEALAVRPTIYDPIGHNPYAHKIGFLGWFAPAFLNKVLVTDVPVAADDRKSITTLPARAYCPSAAELGLRIHDDFPEGHMLPLFRDYRMWFASPSRECIEMSQWQPAHFGYKNLVWYWLRTPNAENHGFVYYKHYTNPYSFKFAASPWMGIRPVMRVADMELIYSEPAGMYLI